VAHRGLHGALAGGLFLIGALRQLVGRDDAVVRRASSSISDVSRFCSACSFGSASSSAARSSGVPFLVLGIAATMTSRKRHGA
jgi:hypothetical protein